MCTYVYNLHICKQICRCRRLVVVFAFVFVFVFAVVVVVVSLSLGHRLGLSAPLCLSFSLPPSCHLIQAGSIMSSITLARYLLKAAAGKVRGCTVSAKVLASPIAPSSL